jgi:hypothetical protein
MRGAVLSLTYTSPWCRTQAQANLVLFVIFIQDSTAGLSSNLSMDILHINCTPQLQQVIQEVNICF